MAARAGDPPAGQAWHATCVALGGIGVVLTGASGAGKSALALQLIDGGAVLVADDITRLTRDGDRLIAHAPAAHAGLIEVRGNGFLQVPYADQAPVGLFVDLARASGERLPEPAVRTELGISVPVISTDPAHPAAAALIRLAVVHGPPHIPENP